jgi:hypothetical protein
MRPNHHRTWGAPRKSARVGRMVMTIAQDWRWPLASFLDAVKITCGCGDVALGFSLAGLVSPQAHFSRASGLEEAGACSLVARRKRVEAGETSFPGKPAPRRFRRATKKDALRRPFRSSLASSRLTGVKLNHQLLVGNRIDLVADRGAVHNSAHGVTIHGHPVRSGVAKGHFKETADKLL